MWSFGRTFLKLSEKEFWGLTLIQYQALCDRYMQGEERKDRRVALVCMVVANAPHSKRKRYRIKDFLPKRAHKQTAEEMWAVLSDWNNKPSGEDNSDG